MPLCGIKSRAITARNKNPAHPFILKIRVQTKEDGNVLVFQQSAPAPDFGGLRCAPPTLLHTHHSHHKNHSSDRFLNCDERDFCDEHDAVTQHSPLSDNHAHHIITKIIVQTIRGQAPLQPPPFLPGLIGERKPPTCAALRSSLSPFRSGANAPFLLTLLATGIVFPRSFPFGHPSSG